MCSCEISVCAYIKISLIVIYSKFFKPLGMHERLYRQRIPYRHESRGRVECEAPMMFHTLFDSFNLSWAVSIIRVCV